MLYDRKKNKLQVKKPGTFSFRLGPIGTVLLIGLWIAFAIAPVLIVAHFVIKYW